MSAPFLEFDLDREIEQLHGEPEWQSGQNARTLVKYDDFRIVLTALKAHVRISAHHTEGRISISTLRGHIRTMRRIAPSIFQWEASSLWVATCPTTWKPLKTALFY
jgi:hypothetical protein